MRLPSDARSRAFVLLGLTAALGACSLIAGGGDRTASVGAPLAAAGEGPLADYPMTLGEPFTVDGAEYIPADTASYDAVGLAAIDDAHSGVSVAHKTLPLPSYVELTSLESGRTILARVERRGPMTGARLVALSPAAQSQLGVVDGAPVRVRRVNPPEAERAELRAGRAVKERMDTPKSLLAVLARKLPAGTVLPVASDAPRLTEPVKVAEALVSPAARVAAGPTPAGPAPRQANEGEPKANGAYPLRPIATARPVPAPASSPRADAPSRAPSAQAATATPAAAPKSGDFVVQAAAFSSKANAQRAANALGGSVSQSGKFYRVRTGPFATRGQAEAALAKVRAAGYSDARVVTAG
jgi:rare lipoprotein A